MRFLRQVEVIVGDERDALRVADLFVKFRIRRESTVTPAEGEVAIHNLIESNERQIHDRARRVQLRVGYGSRSRPVDLSLIFDGDIRRVTRERDKLDRITRIHVGGFLARRVPAIFNHTYSRSVPVREIVADALETYNARSEDDPPPTMTSTAALEIGGWSRRAARSTPALSISWPGRWAGTGTCRAFWVRRRTESFKYPSSPRSTTGEPGSRRPG